MPPSPHHRRLSRAGPARRHPGQPPRRRPADHRHAHGLPARTGLGQPWPNQRPGRPGSLQSRQRPNPRHALYLRRPPSGPPRSLPGQLSVIRSKNSPLSNFYHRLRAHGKPAKVALIATARKLLSSSTPPSNNLQFKYSCYNMPRRPCGRACCWLSSARLGRMVDQPAAFPTAGTAATTPASFPNKHAMRLPTGYTSSDSSEAAKGGDFWLSRSTRLIPAYAVTPRSGSEKVLTRNPRGAMYALITSMHRRPFLFALASHPSAQSPLPNSKAHRAADLRGRFSSSRSPAASSIRSSAIRTASRLMRKKSCWNLARRTAGNSLSPRTARSSRRKT